MKIKGLQKLSLIDYPQKTAATIFVSGCNFRCGFCYNPELVLPKQLKESPAISEEEVFQFLEERKDFLQALVVCGGEPTIHKELPEFIKKIKKLEFLVKLDTNGSNPEMLEKLVGQELLDYIAMDIKAPIGAKNEKPKTPRPTAVSGLGKDQKHKLKIKNKYEQTVGVRVNLKEIEKSIKIIKNSGVDYEFRTTVVPSIHTKEDIVQIAKDLSPAKKYYLQNFEPNKATINPDFQNIKPYPKEYLQEIRQAVKHYFELCEIR